VLELGEVGDVPDRVQLARSEEVAESVTSRVPGAGESLRISPITPSLSLMSGPWAKETANQLEVRHEGRSHLDEQGLQLRIPGIRGSCSAMAPICMLIRNPALISQPRGKIHQRAPIEICWDPHFAAFAVPR
jgi:hypothetical protein